VLLLFDNVEKQFRRKAISISRLEEAFFEIGWIEEEHEDILTDDEHSSC
jgi:hypothetical protein